MIRYRRPQTGFTLLEVLVAILVLVLGVLGMVGLQAASLQANRDAREQSVAVRLGAELGEMMRGNRLVARQTAAGSNPYLFAESSTLTPAWAVDCRTQVCTTTQWAQSDMRDWLARVERALPGARVAVCFDATPYASGLPQWACSGTGGLVVLKIGWTRQATARTGTQTTGDDSNAAGLVDAATRPSVVLPMIPG